MPFIHDKTTLFGSGQAIKVKGVTYSHLHPYVSQNLYEKIFVKTFQSRRKQIQPITDDAYPFLAFPLIFLDLYCRNTVKIQELAKTKADFGGEQKYSYWIVINTTPSLLLNSQSEGSFMNTFHQNFNMDKTTTHIDPKFLQNFYIDCFGGEEGMVEDDLASIIDTCKNTELCCAHIFVIKVNPTHSSISSLPFDVIASISFQLFPLDNVIDGGLVSGYIKWIATAEEYQRRGINSSLLGLLQCMISPDITDPSRPKIVQSKKYHKLSPPTLFTKHGVGNNSHDGAIFFGN